MSVLGKGWMVIRYFLCHSPCDAEVGSSHGALSSTFRLVCHSVGSEDPVSASHMLGLQAGCPIHAVFHGFGDLNSSPAGARQALSWLSRLPFFMNTVFGSQT